MILNDKQIRALGEDGMITPFYPSCIRETVNKGPVVSFGTQSFGYDITLHSQVKHFDHLPPSLVIDPKNPMAYCKYMSDLEVYKDGESEYVILPANGFVLGKCNEAFNMPRDVTAFLMTKSTYARVGIDVKTTPMQAGFKGDLVLEIKNELPYSVRLYVNEGIGQLFFMRGETPDGCYADNGGKYHTQSGITLAGSTVL